ncbi:MAG: UDP-N-acetylmuramate--L-alanine ligase [Bacteroidetes bacterium]|nr:UDP-N-acetylmuramate--L-alanine ligase [Bacteroidota bacterium]MBU1372053.1 UDP-N-acetylmuramate--L-alanine ligase [Bacteroidota bacterium]MBU1483655.1 UDP-N-acetylmuramate--L-alanine ligase [Bacteroidota bacterium]MBU1760131.1 UDP-N-acetylmuramate--L-alanine ligase [Bacteroidota bacterium]MBU2267143.1 UDP-N-acetylmuramate--L-alanine ligase [Bacteroidota bacterium]
MELANIKRVYLIGIGGIGMSGIARYFHHQGALVCGYDKTSTPLTRSLQQEGICISYEDQPNLIPLSFQKKEIDTLVIYTPAIPKNSQVLKYFTSIGFRLYKRSEVLGIISKGMFTIGVAGTHGKTTTSCLITHLLKAGGIDCSAFLGGISTNYQTNFLIGSSNVLVVEADEFDRSFLTLHPDIAIITSMDADHLDIYGAKEQLEDSFRLFANQLKPEGTLIHRNGLPLSSGLTYGLDEQSEIKGTNIEIKSHEFFFDWSNSETKMKQLHLGLPGQHNIENAVAAIEVALRMGISIEDIKVGLTSFSGVKRRFEYIVRKTDRIYIDDYAHHPEELKACFKAVRSLYPNKKLTVIFQPHLFSRTRDFATEFSEVLNTVDELLLLDIYPARELPIPGITSQLLASQIAKDKVRVCGKEEALEIIKNEKPSLLLTVGAGDIDTLVEPLKSRMDYA